MSSKHIGFTVLSFWLSVSFGINQAMCESLSTAPPTPVITAPATTMADPTGAQSKTQVCASCHGDTGNGIAEMPTQPKLAGQHPKYTIKQLQEFRQGATSPRPNGIMLGFSQNLSDADIKEIADFYAAQSPTVGTVPANLLALGQQIYRGGILKSGVPACAACHGANGSGNALMSAPALSGQFPEYIISQMQAFKAAERKNDPNAMMREIAKKMTDEEIQAVAHYLSGLH